MLNIIGIMEGFAKGFSQNLSLAQALDYHLEFLESKAIGLQDSDERSPTTYATTHLKLPMMAAQTLPPNYDEWFPILGETHTQQTRSRPRQPAKT